MRSRPKCACLRLSFTSRNDPRKEKRGKKRNKVKKSEKEKERKKDINSLRPFIWCLRRFQANYQETEN